MARNPLVERLGRRLRWHQSLHDPQQEPRNRLRWLPELRRWQAERLEASFEHFLNDPKRRAAALFFLTDVYGDHDFSGRDANVAKVMPMMQRLLPAAVLHTVADGIELGALTHALDVRMAEALQRIAPGRRKLDAELYAKAYREVGHPRLRRHQIDLIAEVGVGLARAVKTPGVATLLKLSRGPAKATGLGDLQGFLERGFAAFAALGDGKAFVRDIEEAEREVSRRLFAGEPDPFA
ncbi:FFLEELY motif protein [Pseudoxanthomonas putridarboris]|uniref:DUF8198 domain-containing protein n=1 Tax=Pseudoxanthomonas putridarboris TaxID=752605 RepID=A0ABU9J0N3_9GAMM